MGKERQRERQHRVVAQARERGGEAQVLSRISQLPQLISPLCVYQSHNHCQPVPTAVHQAELCKHKLLPSLAMDTRDVTYPVSPIPIPAYSSSATAALHVHPCPHLCAILSSANASSCLLSTSVKAASLALRSLMRLCCPEIRYRARQQG